MRHTRGVIDRTAARTRGSGRLLLAPGLRESAFRLAERTRAAQQNQVFRAYRYTAEQVAVAQKSV